MCLLIGRYACVRACLSIVYEVEGTVDTHVYVYIAGALPLAVNLGLATFRVSLCVLSGWMDG